MKHLFLFLIGFAFSCGSEPNPPETNEPSPANEIAQKQTPEVINTIYSLRGIEIDLKNCKTFVHNTSLIEELNYDPQIWCGDLAGRFTINSGSNETKASFYDHLLKGYWSDLSATFAKTKNLAEQHCSSLGEGWSLPDIYKLISLIEQLDIDIDASFIYNVPLHDELNNKWLWSNTETLSANWGVFFPGTAMKTNLISESFENHFGFIRCFKAEAQK